MAAFLRTHAASILRHAVFAALAAVLALPLRAQAPGSGAAGQVVDASTGAPLADARIEIEGSPHSAWTDDGGRFSLPLPPGQDRALIRHPGYMPTSEGGWVSDGLLSVTVGLEPREIVLPPIEIVSRPEDYFDLRSRIRRTGGLGMEAPVVVDKFELAKAPHTSMLDFILARLSLMRVP